MEKKDKKIALVFAVWFFINILTASYTELLADEAYYWLYGSKLDWGYFDHPPMIALFNSFIDRYIFHSELSVRFLSILSSTFYLWIVYKIINPQNSILFLSILFSSAAINIFGFVSVPDTPLLLFSALFYFLYIRYIQNEDWVSILGLLVVIPLLFYTKYHAVLILIFSIIAYPKVFYKKSFYIIFLLSLLLYTPHILWQISNDYPSVNYHLLERSSSEYEFKYTLDYLFGQFVFYGPILTIITFFVVFTRNFKDDFKFKLLKINYIGFFLFFLVSSYKGWVEVNWTLPALTAIITFSYYFVNQKSIKFQRNFIWLHVAMVALFFLLRIELIGNFTKLPFLERFQEFRQHKKLALKVKEHTQNQNVCTVRYQEAALLSFYMNKFVPAINLEGRKNIFNIWREMEKVNGLPYYLISSNQDLKGNKIFTNGKIDYYLSYHKNLPAIQGVEINSIKYKNGQLILEVPKKWIFEVLKMQKYSKTYLSIELSENEIEEELIYNDFNNYEANDNNSVSIKIAKTLKNGSYKVKIRIKTDGFGGWSKKIIKEIIVD